MARTVIISLLAYGLAFAAQVNQTVATFASGAVVVALRFNDANGAVGAAVITNKSSGAVSLKATRDSDGQAATARVAAGQTQTVNFPNNLLTMVEDVNDAGVPFWSFRGISLEAKWPVP